MKTYHIEFEHPDKMALSYGPNTAELLKRIAGAKNGELSISHLKLTGIPELPDNITFLNCCCNPDLKELPKLPPKLKYLVCAYTGITSLPKLPNTLLNLDCMNTPITSLPPLPSNLSSLWCHHTNIEVLPEFPDCLRFEEGDAGLNFSFTPAAKLYYEPGMSGNQLLRRWRKHWRKESMERVQNRCRVIKEELMEKTWHPSRIQKLLDAGIELEAV